jgi:L-amino acid N-acyltransferase YncA
MAVESSPVAIDHLRPAHWPEVARIYAAGIATGNATFETAGIWTIQTGIFPENEASLRLHERVGFGVVGHRRRLGKLHGAWRDVVLLERRSDKVE